MSSMTVRKDIRGRFGPARDQGARPTCIAFAMSDTHAAAREPWSALSCEFLFFHAKRREATPPTKGASTRSVREALEHDGQPVEADWGYLPALPKDIKRWQPPATIGPVYRRASSILSGGFTAAWDSVEADTPVMVVMSISDAFYLQDAGELVDSSEPVDPTRRHSVIAVATGELGGKKFLLVRSSWGDTWGAAGYAWVAEPYMAPRIRVMVTVN
jgi:hypothetical protein